MNTLEKFQDLMKGGCIDINDKDANLFRELNLGHWIEVGEMDSLYFNSAFEIDPEDFKSDITFLMNFAESDKERKEFVQFMYHNFKCFWQELAMDFEDLEQTLITRFNTQEEI